MLYAPRRSSTRPMECPMSRSRGGLISRAKRCRGGENGSARRASRALRRDRGPVGRGVFPPAQVAEVKALACELPAKSGVPLSRWSAAELARTGRRARDRRAGVWDHGLALAGRGRDPPVELPLVD